MTWLRAIRIAAWTGIAVLSAVIAVYAGNAQYLPQMVEFFTAALAEQ